MKFREKFDNLASGIISSILFPVLIGLIIFIFTSGEKSLGSYLTRINEANIITHAITLCVFPNIALFLIFNRLDMLKAMRGVLAMTIAWAVAVFIIKFI
jgi:hypothetical protein